MPAYATGIVTQASLVNTDDVLKVPVANAGSAAVQVTGTWAGTLSFEATIDGTNWFAIDGVPPTTAVAVTTTTTNGQWTLVLPGYSQIRVRFNPATSGTAVVTIGVSQSGGVTGGGAGGGGAVTANQGSANTAANAWPVYMTSGAVAQDAYQIAQSADSITAGTTFAALAPTTTLPAAGATRTILTWTGRDSLLLVPFGQNANDLTLRLRVTGWQKIGTLWVPNALCDCTVTLSTLTGVAAASVDNLHFFSDVITVDAGIGIVKESPANDTGLASVEVPIGGTYALVEVQFILNASATSANALYSSY